MMLLYLVLTLLFGGLKGSRSNTVWAMFWAVGIVHFFLRPVPKKIIFAGLIFLAAFMYIWVFQDWRIESTFGDRAGGRY